MQGGGGGGGVLRQGAGLHTTGPSGDLSPQPIENLQTCNQAGAQSEAPGGVHHGAQPGLQAGVQFSQEDIGTSQDRVVFR